MEKTKVMKWHNYNMLEEKCREAGITAFTLRAVWHEIERSSLYENDENGVMLDGLNIVISMAYDNLESFARYFAVVADGRLFNPPYETVETVTVAGCVNGSEGDCGDASPPSRTPASPLSILD